MFDLQVFHHSLDDQIHVLETAPIGRGGDAGDLPLHLPAGHPPPLDLLSPGTRGRLHSAGQSLPVDVAHAHWGICLVGDDLGDPPAHHPRSQHAHLPHFSRCDAEAILLRILRQEEETN